MTDLRVLADYDCYPTWTDSDNVDPRSLGISENLSNDLTSWAERFDAILVRDDPRLSDFPSDADRDSFAEDGVELAERLARELEGRYEVSYYDIRLRHDVQIT